MTAPGNYGPEYKSAFDAIYPELAAQYDTELLGSFFEGLSVDGVLPELSQAQQYFQPDGVHPNAEGVAKIVGAMGPKVLDLIADIKAQ